MLISYIFCLIEEAIVSKSYLGCSGITFIYIPILLYFAYCCYKKEGTSAFNKPLFDSIILFGLFSIYSGIVKPLLSGVILLSADVEVGVDVHIIGLTVGLLGALLLKKRIKYIVDRLPQTDILTLGNNAEYYSKCSVAVLCFFLVSVIAYFPIVIEKKDNIRQSLIDLPPSNTIRQLNTNSRNIIVHTEEEMVPHLFKYMESIRFNKHDNRFSIRHQWLDLKTILFTFDRDLKKNNDSFTVIGKLRSISGKRYDFGILLGSQLENIITVQSEIIICDPSDDSRSDIMKMYHKAAEQGQAIAQTALGLKYAVGEDTEKDYLRAIKWYTKAVEQNEPIAMTQLGNMYSSGYGVIKNYKKALNLYKKSAAYGNAFAQNNLAGMYFDGEGTSQDFGKALFWYQKAADQGNALAQNSLAGMYLDGKGTSQDFGKALMWFRKAANQGNARGQHNLAIMNENGWGTPKNYYKALQWYRRSADQGFAQAQNNLAAMYEKGKGTQQDFNEALKWYQKAANKGNAIAQNNLAAMFYHGKGTSQDIGKALVWFRKSANQGCVEARNNIASIFENDNGDDGQLIDNPTSKRY